MVSSAVKRLQIQGEVWDSCCGLYPEMSQSPEDAERQKFQSLLLPTQRRMTSVKRTRIQSIQSIVKNPLPLY